MERKGHCGHQSVDPNERYAQRRWSHRFLDRDLELDYQRDLATPRKGVTRVALGFLLLTSALAELNDTAK